jgi:hypothetical protein
MELFIKFIAYALGLVAMAGIWLVPARLCSIIALLYKVRSRIGVRIAAGTALVLGAIGLSGFIAADSLPRVFRCLWESYCTANRAGGIINLDLFGASVILVEVAWLASRLLIDAGLASPSKWPEDCGSVSSSR